MNIELRELSIWRNRQDHGVTWTIMMSGGDGGGAPPTAAAMTARPPRFLITRDAFSGDGNWDEWIEHFDG